MPPIHNSVELTAIDLFSGCGGLTLGLKLAGFRVLSAVEIEANAAATYRANHPDVALNESDVRLVSPLKLRRKLGLNRGELHLLAGCPPCQGFSRLRTLNGDAANDKRNALIHQMTRFARAFRPKAIMMENVPGLANEASFRRLCRDLKKLGYKVRFSIKDASDYGVPQRRRRLILVAGDNIEIPFARNGRRIRTVRDAIFGLPIAGKSRDPLHNLLEKRRSPKVERLIRDIPKDGGSRTDLPKRRQLRCHRNTDGFRDVYGRMAWKKVAPTITSGCFNPSKGRFLHPKLNRTITMREAAMLQTFPRSYKFDVRFGREAIALMIGNALPPEFIRRHALSIRRTLTT